MNFVKMTNVYHFSEVNANALIALVIGIHHTHSHCILSSKVKLAKGRV
jgi:hypothetical protein